MAAEAANSNNEPEIIFIVIYLIQIYNNVDEKRQNRFYYPHYIFNRMGTNRLAFIYKNCT